MCFFFKQKTAYEMRISDWSSDVCSSDLTPLSPLYQPRRRLGRGGGDGEGAAGTERRHQGVARALVDEPAGRLQMPELRLSRRRLHQKAGILREWRQGARARGAEIPREALFLRAAQRRRPAGALRFLAGNEGPADRADAL